MRLDTSFKNSDTNQASFTIGRGHLNGVYVNSSVPGFRVTIRLRTKSGTEVLVPNMPLSRFAYLTDYFYGAGGDVLANLHIKNHSVINRLMQIIGATATTDAQLGDLLDAWNFAAPGHTRHGNMIRVDLGSIFLSDGDEIQFDFNSAQSGFLQVTAFSDTRSPYELLIYEEIKDKNYSVSKAQAIFTHVDLPVNQDYHDIDCTYKITDSDDTFLTDQIAVSTASALLGRFEQVNSANLGLLWSNPAGIPDTVNVQLTGSHADSATMTVIRKVYPSQDVSKNTVLESRKFVERVRKLEKQDPETAKALRHAQVIPAKADAMEETIRTVEHAQQIDELQKR